MHLYESGVITNKKKSLYPGKFVCAFITGSPGIYDWVDNNVSIMVMRGDWVNDPSTVRQNSKMVSVNTCMMIDLTGQIMSESIGPMQFSGTGGQFDTAFGARSSIDKLGKSIIACRSTAKKGTVSSIVSLPPQGTPVTLLRRYHGLCDNRIWSHPASGKECPRPRLVPHRYCPPEPQGTAEGRGRELGYI